MKLIKFRAWDKIKKVMLYDVQDTYDDYHADNFYQILNERIPDEIGCWDEDSEHRYEVMQFTGLYDKNGKEIYEGDILRGFTYPYLSDDHYNYLAEVVWFDNCAAFGIVTHKAKDSKVSGISDGNTDYMVFWNPDDWEVIGNIYENPELLGENYDS